VVHPVDADADEVVAVTVREAVPRTERPLREGVALGTERRRRGELRAEDAVASLGVAVPRVRVPSVAVQVREVVAERRVVDAALLEQVPRRPVERDVAVAGGRTSTGNSPIVSRVLNL